MGQQPFHQLLDELQRLWWELRTLFWNRRLHPGKPEGEVGQSPGPLQPLSDLLDIEVAQAEPRQNSSRSAAADDDVAVSAAGKKKPLLNRAIGFFDELSGYLRGKRRATSLQPSVAEKLRKSAWEHVRTAARAAKEGNTEKAKLYAGLADNAIKEAARYMPAEDFRAFRQEVEESLKIQSRK